MYSYWKSKESMRSSAKSNNRSKLNSRNALRKTKADAKGPVPLKPHQLNHLRHRLNTFVK